MRSHGVRGRWRRRIEEEKGHRVSRLSGNRREREEERNRGEGR